MDPLTHLLATRAFIGRDRTTLLAGIAPDLVFSSTYPLWILRCGRVRAVIDGGAWPVPPIFAVLQDLGSIPDDEMLRVFNMGLGLIFIAGAGLDPRPECPSAVEVGRVVPRHEETPYVRWGDAWVAPVGAALLAAAWFTRRAGTV